MGKDEEKYQGMAELAAAMTKLATTLERFQDPVIWQKIFRDAIATGFVGLPLTMPPPISLPQPGIQGETRPVPVGRIESVTVNLSEEERAKLAARVHELVQPQLAEFNQFMSDALQQMPAAQLKELAEKIEAGAKPKLRRKYDCVFLELDTGEKYYLGL